MKAEAGCEVGCCSLSRGCYCFVFSCFGFWWSQQFLCSCVNKFEVLVFIGFVFQHFENSKCSATGGLHIIFSAEVSDVFYTVILLSFSFFFLFLCCLFFFSFFFFCIVKIMQWICALDLSWEISMRNMSVPVVWLIKMPNTGSEKWKKRKLFSSVHTLYNLHKFCNAWCKG